jgi:gas vesicle protein
MKTYRDLLNKAESLIKDVNTTTSRNDSDTGKILAAAIIGLAVGGILGILFAPGAGAETRSTIAGSVSDLSGTVREKTKVGIDKLSELKNQAVDSVRSKVNGSASENEPVA